MKEADEKTGCIGARLRNICGSRIMPRLSTWLLCALVAALSACVCLGQWGGRGSFWQTDTGPMVQTEGEEWVNEDTVRTARETAPHSVDLPVWTNAPGFGNDVFVFTRSSLEAWPDHDWSWRASWPYFVVHMAKYEYTCFYILIIISLAHLLLPC